MPSLNQPGGVNVTVNIYRSCNLANPVPPANTPAAVQGVNGFLKPDMVQGRHAFTVTSTLRWTHVLLLPLGVDIRDAYNGQQSAPNLSNADTVILLDSTGKVATPFVVMYVEVSARGQRGAHLRVYLDRFQPQSWPTDGL
jgi:hypothetical protein